MILSQSIPDIFISDYPVQLPKKKTFALSVLPKDISTLKKQLLVVQGLSPDTMVHYIQESQIAHYTLKYMPTPTSKVIVVVGPLDEWVTSLLQLQSDLFNTRPLSPKTLSESSENMSPVDLKEALLSAMSLYADKVALFQGFFQFGQHHFVNDQGRSVAIHSLSISDTMGSVVVGLNPDVVFVPSFGLHRLSPRGIFHVASCHIGDDYGLSVDDETIENYVEHHDLLHVTSKTPQETVHMALLCNFLKNVVHSFPMKNDVSVQLDITNTLKFHGDVKEIFSQFSQAVGIDYAPFEYHGPTTPKTVYVSTGSLDLTDLVHPNDGYIYVRVPNPFDEKAFLSLLPSSVEQVKVVSFGQSLFYKIQRIYEATRWIKTTPKTYKEDLYAVKQDTSALVLGKYSWGLKWLKSYFSHKEIHSFDLNPVKGGKATSFNPSDKYDFILLDDAEFLEDYSVGDSLKPRSTLVISSTLTADALLQFIPLETVYQLKALQVTVYHVPVKQVAKNMTVFFGEPLDYEGCILEYLFLSIFDPSALNDYKTFLQSKSENPNVISTKMIALDSSLECLKRLQLPSSDLKPIVPYATVDAVQRSVQVEPCLPVLFPSAFQTSSDYFTDEKVYSLQVTKNIRVTPDSYDRNIFHMEMSIPDDFKYEIGDALGVYPVNPTQKVVDFLHRQGLNPQQVVEYQVNGKTTLKTLESICIHSIDLFGKPGKSFYQLLAQKAQNPKTVYAINSLLNDSVQLEEFIAKETPTFVDLLDLYSVKLSLQEILNLPKIKPRHYSISSSQRVHKNSVHLLIVLVDWKTASGKQRFGQATEYLVGAKVGQTLTCSIKPSVMRLPKDPKAPVIMAGLGTGMAPFRAFIEERYWLKSHGTEVGPMLLYFGSRHKSQEFLYGEELEAYEAEGLVRLRCAFSRDQPQKVYIQHLIQQDSTLIHSLMEKGSFYLCGPTWPVPDVTKALVTRVDNPEEYLETLKEQERFILEVY